MTDRNHTNRALAEGGTILEIRRDLADFSNCCLRVVHESNHNRLFSIADVQDFEMVDAVIGTSFRATRHWAIVVGPIRCDVRGQNMAEKNCPGNKQGCCYRKETSLCVPWMNQAHEIPQKSADPLLPWLPSQNHPSQHSILLGCPSSSLGMKAEFTMNYRGRGRRSASRRPYHRMGGPGPERPEYPARGSGRGYDCV